MHILGPCLLSPQKKNVRFVFGFGRRHGERTEHVRQVYYVHQIFVGDGFFIAFTKSIFSQNYRWTSKLYSIKVKMKNQFYACVPKQYNIDFHIGRCMLSISLDELNVYPICVCVSVHKTCFV